MSSRSQLRAHLTDSRFRDPSDRFTLYPERLRFFYYEQPGGWRDVAQIISQLPKGTAWFPDANVAILEQTTPVWDALRLVALGTPDGSTVISSVVESEISDWLDAPRHDHQRAAVIRSAMDDESWIRRFAMDASNPLHAALYGYAHLLGFRRCLALPRGDGTTRVGTMTAEKSQTMNAIRNLYGARAEPLAKKGRIDTETRGRINLNDEAQCVLAIMYGLLKSRRTLMLTADADFLEIFYKAQWMIDMHYRGWLAARLIKDGRYGVPAGELVDTQGLFEKPVTLYRQGDCAILGNLLKLGSAAY